MKSIDIIFSWFNQGGPGRNSSTVDLFDRLIFSIDCSRRMMLTAPLRGVLSTHATGHILLSRVPHHRFETVLGGGEIRSSSDDPGFINSHFVYDVIIG